MPLSINETLAIKRMIAEAVAEAVGEIKTTEKQREQVLSNVQERLASHSVIQREIPELLRRSASEIKNTTNDELMAANTHFAKQMAIFEKFVKDELAAIKTPTTQSKAINSVIADDTTEIQLRQVTAQKWANIRMTVTLIIVPILTCILTAFAGAIVKSCSG